MANSIKSISWSDMKTFVSSSTSISKTYLEETSRYTILAAFGSLTVKCILPRGESDSDTTDFDNNYKSTWNSLFPDINQNNQQIVELTGDVTCPSVSKKLRFDHTENNTTITSSYVTLYSYSGSGKLHGFVLDYNSDSVRTKLTIDGSDEIFELTMDEIEDLQSYTGGGCDDSQSSELLGGFIKKSSGNKLNVEFKCPIKYETSVLIEAQRTSGSNKRLDRRIVFIEKET